MTNVFVLGGEIFVNLSEMVIVSLKVWSETEGMAHSFAEQKDIR